MRAVVAGLWMLAVGACSAPEDEAKKPEAPVTAAAVSFDGADYQEQATKVAHGERLTKALGCRGCHTPSLQGQQFYELYASNLTRDVPRYSDAELERLIRAGVHPSGRDVWGMPSEIFQHLSDEDLAAIIATLRTLQPDGEPTGKPLPFDKELRDQIAAGKFKPAADFVRETKNVGPVDLGTRHALGRYIARTTCAECHGPELKGYPGDTPDLIVAGGYSREEFEKLITKGIPPGNRKLKELMEVVAQNRFSNLTPHERDALYAYLKARAEQPQ